MYNDAYNSYLSPISIDQAKPGKLPGTGLSYEARTNIVSGEKLKKVQLYTLKVLADALVKTFGPMGSYTEILQGSTQDNTFAKYSKDGLSVLKHIYFDRPIEMTIQSEIEEVCRYEEKIVGDATTSAVLLSYYIFKGLLDVEKKYNAMPRTIMKYFNEIVKRIQGIIKDHGRETTLDDIYKICMISTNGNEMVSSNIAEIYEDHGLDVDITVDISNDADSKVKEYEGISIDVGYSDPAYVNNKEKNTANIHNAKVYYFADSADDVTMIQLFEKILYDNIVMQISNNQNPIPTVIMCPKLSRDSGALLNQIISTLFMYDAQEQTSQKPQVLVLTNYLGADEGVANDIARLCGCKEIHKYINPEHEKVEIENGNAPTLENIHSFAGGAELVVADSNHTMFTNPKAMMDNPAVYTSLIEFLKTEIREATEKNEDALYIGRTKNRLKRLQANSVIYYIGGITISDRDALRDLVIDAVKNCRSAAINGVGYAANYEGLRASYDMVDEIGHTMYECHTSKNGNIYYDVAKAIFQAYHEVSVLLYSTVQEREAAEGIVKSSLDNDCPINIVDIINEDMRAKKDTESTVLSSIATDIEALNAIEKIVGLMVTSNQAVLQSTALNNY